MAVATLTRRAARATSRRACTSSGARSSRSVRRSKSPGSRTSLMCWRMRATFHCSSARSERIVMIRLAAARSSGMSPSRRARAACSLRRPSLARRKNPTISRSRMTAPDTAMMATRAEAVHPIQSSRASAIETKRVNHSVKASEASARAADTRRVPQRSPWWRRVTRGGLAGGSGAGAAVSLVSTAGRRRSKSGSAISTSSTEKAAGLRGFLALIMSSGPQSGNPARDRA